MHLTSVQSPIGEFVLLGDDYYWAEQFTKDGKSWLREYIHAVIIVQPRELNMFWINRVLEKMPVTNIILLRGKIMFTVSLVEEHPEDAPYQGTHYSVLRDPEQFLRSWKRKIEWNVRKLENCA